MDIIYSRYSTESLINVLHQFYSFDEITCKSLEFGINDIYEITNLPDNKKFILRISPSIRYLPHSEEGYNQEVNLLNFLNNCDISVVKPIQTRYRTYVGKLEAVEGERYFVLFHFISGDELKSVNDDLAYKLGRLLGCFHLKSMNYEGKLDRFEFDIRNLITVPLETLFTKSRRNKVPEILETVVHKIKTKVENIESNLSYGIIHGDYQLKNMIKENEKITLLDFDMTCKGFHLFDIAVFLSSARIFYTGYSPSIVSQFIEGYTTMKKLNPIEKRYIPLFEIIRSILVLGENTIQMERFGQKEGELLNESIISSIIKWSKDNIGLLE